MPHRPGSGKILLFAKVGIRHFEADHSHGRNAFPSPDESNALIGRGLDAELLGVELQTLTNTGFHVGDMRVDLGFFCNDGDVDIHQDRLMH